MSSPAKCPKCKRNVYKSVKPDRVNEFYCNYCRTYSSDGAQTPAGSGTLQAGQSPSPYTLPFQRPAVLYYTEHEGDYWKKFNPGKIGSTVHALIFSDGSIWDASNGWRAHQLYSFEIVAVGTAVYRRGLEARVSGKKIYGVL